MQKPHFFSNISNLLLQYWYNRVSPTIQLGLILLWLSSIHNILLSIVYELQHYDTLLGFSFPGKTWEFKVINLNQKNVRRINALLYCYWKVCNQMKSMYPAIILDTNRFNSLLIKRGFLSFMAHKTIKSLKIPWWIFKTSCVQQNSQLNKNICAVITYK